MALIFFQANFNLNIIFTTTFTAGIFWLMLVFKIAAVCVMVALFWLDLKSGLLIDKITIPGILIALLYQIALPALKAWAYFLELKSNPFGQYLLPPHSQFYLSQVQRLAETLIWNVSAAVGLSLFFASIIILTRGKGMGWGDVKYALLLGLILGYPNSVLAIFLSFLLGAIWAVGLLISGQKKLGQTIPFGPFMSLGGLIALFWGEQIISWYLQLGPFLTNN